MGKAPSRAPGIRATRARSGEGENDDGTPIPGVRRGTAVALSMRGPSLALRRG
jgi:hypothetical protein